jgi:ketosteroid isomerase-like protein
MGNYRFTECKVTRVHEIVVEGDQQPRTAVASFNVYAAGTFKVNNETITTDLIRRIELYFRQEEDGRWRVVNYQHSAPLPGRRNEDDNGYGSGIP